MQFYFSSFPPCSCLVAFLVWMLHVLESIWKSTDVITVSNVQANAFHKALSSFYLFFYIFWWTQGKKRIIGDSGNYVSKGDQSNGLYKLKKQTKPGVGTGRMERVQFPSKICRNYYLYFQKWMKNHSSLLMAATFPSITALPQNNMTSSPVAICHLSSQILTEVMDRDWKSSLHPPPTVPRRPNSPPAGLLGQYCLNSKWLKAAGVDKKPHQSKQHETVSALILCWEDSPTSHIILWSHFSFLLYSRKGL